MSRFFCCFMYNFQVWWCFHTWVVKLYSRSSNNNKTQAKFTLIMWQKNLLILVPKTMQIVSLTCMLSGKWRVIMWKMNGTFLSHLLSSFSVFWFCQANHPHKKSVQKHKAWMDGLSIVVKKKHFLDLVQDWHGMTWNMNLHPHCWHIFLNIWTKSSGGGGRRKPFIPEMPAASSG